MQYLYVKDIFFLKEISCLLKSWNIHCVHLGIYMQSLILKKRNSESRTSTQI